MNTLRALLYADARTLVNQLKSIRTSPLRAIMWSLFALLVVGGITLRITRAAHHTPLPFGTFAPRFANDVIACLIVAGLGIALAAGSRFAGLFAHAAEARIIIGSPATPFVATIYVQAREIVVNGARRGLGVMWAAFFYLPANLDAGTFVRDLAIIVVAFCTIAALPLARQLFDARAAAIIRPAGYAIAALAIVPIVRDVAAAVKPAPPLGSALLALPQIHPGALLTASAAVQYAAIAGMAACLAVTFVYVAWRARDAYPELYELSMNRLSRTERLRNRMLGTRASAKTPQRVKMSDASRAPGGVAIFLWRAWTEYRRTSDERSTGIETAALLIGGYAAARLAAGNDFAFGAMASSLSTVLYILALARAAQLAAELRRPLFWLSSATLFERLAALAVAHAWRIMAWFVLFAIGLVAGGAHVPIVMAAALAGPAAVYLAVGVSYASYAVLPHDIDQRGPLMALRVLAGYILVVPAIGVAIAITAFAHSSTFAIGGAAVAAAAEALVLIGFASWRLDRMSIPLR